MASLGVVSSQTDWVVTCGRNDRVLANGVSTVTGIRGTGNIGKLHSCVREGGEEGESEREGGRGGGGEGEGGREGGRERERVCVCVWGGMCMREC